MNAIIDFILFNVLSVLIVLGVLVFCHELGHFLLAKLFNVRVLKFALGFGPKIVWKQIGETEYSIRWIPLGGFVKLLGEDDDEEIKKLPPEEATRSLDQQSVLKKIAILAAGSVFNILLTFFILWGAVFMTGEPIYHLKANEVIAGAPAEKAGIKPGDLIIALNDEPITPTNDLNLFLLLHGTVPFQMTVQREGKTHILDILPIKKLKELEPGGDKIKMAYIGVNFQGIFVEIKNYNLWGSSIRGLQRTSNIIRLVIVSTVKLFQRDVPVSSLGGIVGIAKKTGDEVRKNPFNLIGMIAMLGVAIGLLNLFPIPILDGSLIVIVIIEAISRRRLGPTQKEWIFKIGLAFLIALMLFATYNDIVYRILKKSP